METSQTHPAKAAPKLQVLPAQVANLIAAGEVVQRPSSVVKELMENAVDSGASSVSVSITDAGRTLIQIIDNGCGMSPSDGVLCFERHATSKISEAGDLSRIQTYGFRGEALASIAAVSEVTLVTRRESDETATKIKISAGSKLSSASVAAPQGSNFAVRNLFYNTPARRKFLKSDNIELKHIIEEFTRIAITRPELSFRLSSNGRELFDLKAAKSLKFRIQDLLGSGILRDVVDISADTSIIQVRGFVGRPDTARKTLGNQFFFLNGRFFRSPYLHKAVMKAYEDLVPEGVTPSYFIFLSADPESVDINIHPTKTEVKFEEESVVFQTLYACVKETIGRHSFGASLNFDTEGAVELPQIGKSFEQYKGISSPDVCADPSYNPFAGPSFNSFSVPNPFEDEPQEDQILPAASRFTTQGDCSALFDEPSAGSGSKRYLLWGKYIITPVPAGLMLVHIARARERILYDQIIRALKSNSHVSQASLFPVQVQVGAASRLLFEEYSQMLGSIGFDIRSFGVDTVVVYAVPEGYSCEGGEVQKMVEDLVYILSDSVSALPELMQQRVAEKLAMLGSVGASLELTEFEAQKLLDTLFASDNAELTSNGRKIIKLLPCEEVDKMF